MIDKTAYCLKNGILYIDGKAVFGIGSHYYPSYHPKKVPVPENGDRYGEMKRDFADMKAAHVNIVRTAAVGTFSERDGDITGSFPLGEAIAEELEKNGCRTICTRLSKDSEKLGAFEFKAGDSIVIGNEGHGVGDMTAKVCAHSLYIPMNDGAESLNAACAAAITIWEMKKCSPILL